MNQNNSFKKQKRKLNIKRRVIYLAIAAMIFFTAIYIIPIEVYENYTILFSAIFGITGSFFLFQAMFDYGREDWNSNGGESTDYSVLWLSLFVVLIPVLLIVNQSNRKDNLLLDDGIAAKGTVMDLSKYKMKGNEIFDVSIKYRSGDDVEHNSVASVGESEYYKLKRGQEVDIFYSPSNPEIVSLLNSKYTREKFNIKNSDLGIEEDDGLPKTLEETQALMEDLNAQMIKEKDKTVQIEILEKYLIAKNHLKQFEQEDK